jgi:collagenase-like PrtC family protease
MIKFYLPNFYDYPFENLNYYMATQMKEHPEYFYNDIKIGALFGTFPGVIWNGGRTIVGDFDAKHAEKTIKAFNDLDIPIRFTYTNLLIDSEEQLLDPIANFVTTLAHNGKNEIIVSNDYLEAYLRENYPNYKYISSTTKCILNNEDIVKESEKYYMTVLDYRKNRDMEFLDSLEHPERYEILINAWCDPNCKKRRAHYEQLSREQLYQIGPMPGYDQFNCGVHTMTFFDSFKRETVLKPSEIYNIYVPMGFENFKIEGRTYPIVDVLETYLHYMIRPEWRDRFRLNALRYIGYGNK